MTHKADVIDDATKQMTLIAFFRMFFRVPPTQMSTYDQKFGMKMIARTWRLLLLINAKKKLIFDQRILEIAIANFMPHHDGNGSTNRTV